MITGRLFAKEKQVQQDGSLSKMPDIAFSIDDFTVDDGKSVAYLEGRTDEMYFRKAMEVFGYDNPCFEFQWVGHIAKKGDKVEEEFTGKSGLDSAVQFMKGRKPLLPQVFVYDCDANRQEYDDDNIVIINIPYQSDCGVMNKGIENSLNLQDIELKEFYKIHTVKKDYGGENTTKELDKIKLAEYICNLDNDDQKRILKNLKIIIDRIVERIDVGRETES